MRTFATDLLGWEAVSSPYRNSPFLNIDAGIATHQKAKRLSIPQDGTAPESVVVEATPNANSPQV